MEKNIILEIKNMTKSFGPTVALKKVNLTISRGEIHGLIGENGSGKSTVSSIASGMQKADKGEMFFEGKLWKPSSMLDALSKGIGMIVQESGTVSGITVAENIFLGETNQFSKMGFINPNAINRAAQKVLDDIGASYIKANRITGSLNMQDRKLIEIAKIMMKKPEILIVDETSTVLSHDGRKILYEVMKNMKEEGKAVIFISHDLEEIMEVCNMITVLRDGDIIRTFTKEQFNSDEIRTSMIGRELEGDYYRSDYEDNIEKEISIKAEGINLGNKLKNINLVAHKGEILGIGGISDCGMHELGKILFGAIKADCGQVIVRDKVVKNEAFAMKEAIGYVSKDRDTESLNLSASIRDNIAIGGLNKITEGSFIVMPSKEKKFVKNQIERFSIKCFDMEQDVSQLSGGNKQKVVLGKWIGRGSEILILDCPTRGVDIGVKQSIYHLMYKMKQDGRTIIMISEELPELIGMSDRILIMKDGEISGEFKRSKELTDADIISYMV